MKCTSIPMMYCVVVTLFATLFVVAGCADSSQSEVAYERSVPSEAFTDAEQSARVVPGDSNSVQGQESTDLNDEAGNASSNVSTTRKIIYNANVRLVVKDFDPIEKQLRGLIDQYKGFVSSSDVDTERGEYRSGNWTTRIPVENYSAFLDSLDSLGSVTSRSESGQDVTEEFVDLSARISNKQKLEARIIELLENRDDKIKDVIEVERELSRVREEIERMQGRIRYLSDRSSLATVTIHAVEQRDFKPAETMTFGERISNTWADSLSGLLTFGKNLLVFLVAIAPWAIASLIVLVPFYLLLRRTFWRSRGVEG